MSKKPATAPNRFRKTETPSVDSASHLAELYSTPEFELEWANDLSFHLAEQTILLRRHRGMSQAELAEKIGGSQPQVARIEAGGGNVTLGTVERIANALGARLHFSMIPAEQKGRAMAPRLVKESRAAR